MLDPCCNLMTRNRGCELFTQTVILRSVIVLLLLLSLMLLSPSCPKITGNPPTTGSTPPSNCGVGEEWCGGRCVSTATFLYDAANCGRCNNHCSMSETCTGGSCACAPGYTTCMGSCVNPSAFISDPNNCGRCGNQCSINESCMGGTCMKNP